MARPERAAKPAVIPASSSVFVNCPFDDDYLPLLHALLFAIHDCGFVARIAVEDAGASEMRIEKIVRLISESRYSIHDISRVEGADPARLPRFNMPFEAGLAFGAVRFAVRAFLALKKDKGQKTRGAAAIWSRYQRFNAALPGIAAALELTASEVDSFDYLADWLAIVANWVLADKP